jgi:hypothetical protein
MSKIKTKLNYKNNCIMIQNKDKIRLQKQLYYQKNKARIIEQVRNNRLKKKQIQNTE